MKPFFRLAEAHARLMCRNEVTVFDAVTVTVLLDTSIDSNAGLEFEMSSDTLHSAFPDDPTSDYLKSAEKILTGQFTTGND